MNKPIDLWYRVRATTMQGEAVAVIDVEIPDDAPQLIREGLARRATVNAGGTCPCGARFVMPNRATRRKARRTGEVIAVTVAHEPDCPASLNGWRAVIP